MSRANPRYRRNNPSLAAITGNTCGVVKVQGLIEGQMTVNTFMYYTPGTGPTAAQAQAFLTSFVANMMPKIRACCSADWTVTQVTFEPADGMTWGQVVDTSLAGQPGTGPAGHEPTTVASVLSRITAYRGQHGRGRLLLPAVPTGWVTSSTITLAGGITALTALGTQMLLTISDGTNTWVPCIGQRAKLSPRFVTYIGGLTTFIVRTLLGTCRRRKIGRGK